ncbi:probable 39S ribosomal protein L49, mitochondrial isoform X2 [Harpegnathos saltator]|uniref:probable 39S ribosomal protein L49, mitochondrial isoform X2 n=1 Tax=Harpegnathos saltator TaxID=610380 RepID=UPI00058E279C|nr:probable 39S ribosomal protein L49, mitochondrial isoform X2 [Harpegnathos saltator]
MAALRILTRVDLAAILRPARPPDYVVTRSHAIALVGAQIQHRWASYKSSPVYTTPEDYTDYEITKDPNEWKYVERLLPYKTIPKPPTGDIKLPSGWKPACASPTDYPYFIRRTRNHMQPVYLEITYRGMRKITIVSNIEGDIWELEHELKTYLKNYFLKKKTICSQIHEFSGRIKFQGDYVSRIKEWMDMKGF